MKIAIYGGAFNPVHNEHLNIVSEAKVRLGFDKIIVVPTFISPHKSGSMTARGKDRLAMCRKAFSGTEGVEVSDFEIKRGGVSYSYITCRHFRKTFPDDELYFIMGADSLRGFHLWREPEEILKCVIPAVCARETADGFAGDIKKFGERFRREIVTFDYVGKAVGSTRIRALAALEEDISAFVPAEIKKYIVQNRLYCVPEIKGFKSYLTKERLIHTVGVAVTAAMNCRRLRVFEIDAITAAALHDCAKYLSAESPQLKGFVCPRNVPEAVFHQYAGAYLAEHTFGVKDSAVLDAIRYHTSGRENMSALEKLIFLSDMLEEGRDYPGVDELRDMFPKDVDKCLLAALERQLYRLEKTGGAVYPLTRRAYNYLKENL